MPGHESGLSEYETWDPSVKHEAKKILLFLGVKVFWVKIEGDDMCAGVGQRNAGVPAYPGGA